MNDSFWVDGNEIHEKSLREEHQKIILSLQDAIAKCCDESEVCQLKRKIETAEADFKKKLRELDNNLY